MKGKLLLCAFMLPLFSTISSAQVAATAPKTIAMAGKSSTSKNLKKSQKKIKVHYQYATNVPDSISKKVDKASQKMVALYVAGLRKTTPGDTQCTLRTWTSYKSKVIGAPTQVLIDINCTVKPGKNHRKPPTTEYNVSYRADQNIYRISYDSRTRKTKIAYNESYWPGYMYNDKAPTKADLDKDISLAMEHIMESNIILQ